METPLTDSIRVVDRAAIPLDAANPHASSINVHAGRRDQRTIEAIQRLIGCWQPSQADIDREFNDFFSAVRALPQETSPKDMSKTKEPAIEARPTLQARLLRVLGVGLDGEPIAGGRDDFGGLLTGHEGMVTLQSEAKSVHIKGRELIARFWHFASTYKPEEACSASSNASLSCVSSASVEHERANIITAIMNGLADGLQTDSPTTDHVVCDPGKIQRLVTGTLNGYLRLQNGLFVDIDDNGLVNGPKKAAGGGGGAVAVVGVGGGGGAVAVVGAGAAGGGAVAVVEAGAAGGGAVAVVEAGAAALAAAPVIMNFNEIAQYLQPFVVLLMEQDASARPRTGDEFFMRLFQYLNQLADGDVLTFGRQRINLDPASVVYYMRMMTPAVIRKDEGRPAVITAPAEIDPEGSFVACIGLDTFRVDDYMAQFGVADRAQLAAARRDEAGARALRGQQDREGGAGAGGAGAGEGAGAGAGACAGARARAARATPLHHQNRE